MKKVIATTLVAIIVLINTSCLVSSVGAQDSGELNIRVTLTVEGVIDAYDDDPDEFLDPLYYVWIDANGNPNDGGYGNGQGTYQTGIHRKSAYIIF